MALKLMTCIFTKEELANGTPTGTTTSKDERRIKTVQKLNPAIMQYIEGVNKFIHHEGAYHNTSYYFYTEKVEAKWPGGYKLVHRQISQKCGDAYGKNPHSRFVTIYRVDT